MATFRERVKDLAKTADITLENKELEQLAQYYRLLERWNRRINLTALPLRAYPSKTLNRLLLEPIVASRLVEDRPLTWFDLGSGGGSPAIPLKVLRPAATLTMVESKARKAAFLSEVVRNLQLGSTEVRLSRFEDVRAEELGTADLVSVRAVKADKDLWESCTRLLRPDGRLLLFTSSTAEFHARTGFQRVRTAQVPDSDTVVLEVARVFHVEQH